jgi:hypothetical protein
MRANVRILVVLTFLLGFASAARAATIYTSDHNLADFTSMVATYATLSNFSGGDVSSPYTPTSADVAAGFRVYSGGSLSGLNPANNWILATFPDPVSQILVFPNIDHFGASYDGYQYTIQGSNNLSTWTPLFDVTGVSGSGEPFTIGSSTGTAPIWVNNVLTPGAGPGGTVGYEALFDFGAPYKYYAFGASSFAASTNPDQELSAVASVPEPVSLLLFGSGLAAVAVRRRMTRS